jgi:hypothetical protein
LNDRNSEKGGILAALSHALIVFLFAPDGGAAELRPS